MDRPRRTKKAAPLFIDEEKLLLFAECFGVSPREIADKLGMTHAAFLMLLRNRRVSPARGAKLATVLQEIARTGTLESKTFVKEELYSLEGVSIVA